MYKETLLTTKPALTGDVGIKAHSAFQNLWDTQIKDNQSIIENGKQWYLNAFEFCSQQSAIYDIETIKVAAILSKLSPNLHWSQNKKAVIRLLEDKPTLGFPTNIKYAKAIKNGYFGDTIESLSEAFSDSSLKTYSFFRNIYNPVDNRFVTIDRWIVRAIDPSKDGNWLTKKRYIQISNTIKYMSGWYGVLPNQFQAMIWEVMRGKCK